MRRISRLRNICATTSTLLGILLMLAYISEPEGSTDREKFFNRMKSANVTIEDEDDNVTQIEPLPPKCEQNITVASIPGFQSLSPQIQTFLSYRHCRSFPLILDLPHKCGTAQKPEDVFLLLVIKSPPKNYEQREVLRKTWAKERMHNGKWIRTVFITGTDGSGFEKERMNNLLALEHKQYNDILQWDFNESFFNLTLKQILFLEWIDRRCRHVRFLLNGDDDVFAHTENMVEYLQSRDNDGSKHLFIGHLIKDALPIRNPDSKYYIPPEVHEQNPYPPYCGGGGYLLSGYTASVIYNTSKSIEIYPIDDAYMGMCLAEANLQPEGHMGVKTLVWYIPSEKLDRHDPCYMKELLLVHKFSPANLYIMWHEVHNPNLECGISSLR
ncbi:N-acetyllactosaminide beta-1,3-N-acetylglucosaminyltransferase 3-like [Kryptolebias marmoratus]|uniref:Hexosyltransferase n=1 Tax=Kryptolebias marmoratus TaxID=37003 RepID=A0A3Q3BBR0_KRYMA|nr:N-acetyllactosaminide beta-1,3-N-acetylglucosaminyltransferase 3-like [Kryptolebias marmoratus]